MRVPVFAAIGLLALAAEARGATFAVDVTADGVPAWQADALQRTLPGDIADDDLVPGAAPELALHLRVSGTSLTYDVTPLHGAIVLRGLDRPHLARELRDVLRAALAERASPKPVPQPARLPAPGLGLGAWLALLAVAALLAAPFAIARRVRGLRAARRAAVALALIGAAVGLLAIAGEAWSGAFLIAGGIAWGALGPVLLPALFPPLAGLGRVEQDDLLRVLRAWAALAAQRVVAAALVLGPLLALMWGVCRGLDVPALATWVVIAPAWLLVLRIVLHAAVELRATRLDARLVDGAATEDNPWHQAVRGYLAGSVRRAGWPAGDHLLDDLLFLPGTGDQVALYGMPPRIVIPRAWLELALAPYGRPHDYNAPRVSTLEWNEWNAGLVLPVEIGAVVATREQRQPRAEEPRDAEEVPPFGEPATLAGIVEPDAIDLRSAHRPTEDPLWLDYDEGEEHDGTDPSDKDFLFGLLAHALGRIERGEHLLATFTPRDTRAMRLIADLYTTLNFARHHRIQDLAWRAKRREDWLTARAHAPEMARRSAEILAALGDDPAFAAFARSPRRSRAAIWIRRVALAGVVVGGLTAVTAAVLDALAYHERKTDHGQEK